MRTLFWGLLVMGFANVCAAGQLADSSFIERPMELQVESGTIGGTLTLPDSIGKFPLALIIAGSGPTDRNGNSVLTQTDAYKKMAHELAAAGIATLRYDKRGVGQSAKAMKKEIDVRFDDYINDAVGWIQLLRKDDRISSITVVGHSEGSLIGMVAARLANADAYVSVAGGGRPIDKILLEQYEKASPELYALAVPIIDSLRQGLTTTRVDARLFIALRTSVQPYMISWMKYDPPKEIAKLHIPVLLVQGTKDLQVPMGDMELLFSAKKDAAKLVMEDMNHVLKTIKGDVKENAASYKDTSLPLAEGLVDGIARFIKKETR